MQWKCSRVNINHKTRFIYKNHYKITINWGTIQTLENDFYTKVSRIKRLTDPYAHLATFIEIRNTIKIAGVPDEAIRLSLFSFSLVGKKNGDVNLFHQTDVFGIFRLKTDKQNR